MSLVARFKDGVFKQHRKACGRHAWKVLVWYRWEDGSVSEDVIKPSKCYWKDLLPVLLEEMQQTINERPNVGALSFGFDIEV